MASPLASASRGSVQQGLYAAGGVLGFSKLGLAADKRYSLNLSCPVTMFETSQSSQFGCRSSAARPSPFRVATVGARNTGGQKGVKQSLVYCADIARLMACKVGRGAASPLAGEKRWLQLSSCASTGLALADAAQFNRTAQRTAFGVRWLTR